MALEFPSSPTVGQVYDDYVWDGEKWIATGGSGGGTSDEAPVDNRLYGRRNATWAVAPTMDALAYSGMQVNGSMEVSQENGTTAVVAPSGGGAYPVDGWVVISGGVQTTIAQRAVGNAPAGYSSYANAGFAVGNPSPAAADYCSFLQNIEGYRISRLGWGGANAQPLTIAFWVYASRTGMYSGAVRNGNDTRSYVLTFNVNASSTWEYKTITIPGCTDGTWVQDNNRGMQVIINLMAGTNNQMAPNAWAASGRFAATGTTNGAASASDAMRITGVVVLPGTQAPTAAQSSLIMRPYDQELVTCQRYWKRNHAAFGHFVEPFSDIVMFSFAFSMRAAPTVTLRTVVGAVGRPIVAGYDVNSVYSSNLYADGATILLRTSPAAVVNVPATLNPDVIAFDARL